MTSVKYYSNWMREAGRGHIAAILSWGSFLIYLVLKIMELRVDTEYSFFGIGSGELCFLCAGLGLALSFSEFFYLLQVKKQDFYYSLPVRKGTIFWTRYVHGLVQFLVPFLLVQVICTLFELSRDDIFAAYAWQYMIRSMGIFLLIFGMFYHIGILAVVVSGKIVTAVLMLILLLFYAQILVQNILPWFAGEIYRSFYRIPLLEDAGVLAVPGALARELAGTALFDRREVFGYIPEGRYILTAVMWIGVYLVLAALVQKDRKTEMTGKVFISTASERVSEVLVSILAGLFLSVFIMKVFSVAAKGMAVTGGILCVCGVLGVFLAHVLSEWMVQTPQKKLLRRKSQMLAEGIGVCAVILLFVGSRRAFDDFMPQEAEVEKLSVCVMGLDMEQSQFERGRDSESYIVEERLRRYTMSDEGMAEGMEWIRRLRDELEELEGGTTASGNSAESGSKGGADVLTTVTVCYQMKDGVRRYRSYPVDRNMLEGFAGVYETGEYKGVTYPLVEVKSLEQERITWEDGAIGTAIKLSEEEKGEMLKAYKADVSEMKMADLQTALPSGFIEVESQVSGVNMRAVVYPFFERTCAFLDKQGIDTGKQLSEYRITSLKVLADAENGRGSAGGRSVRFYDEEEEIEQWSGKLIPEEFAIQPLFYPVDTAVQAEAEIQDEDTNSAVIVDCYTHTSIP